MNKRHVPNILYQPIITPSGEQDLDLVFQLTVQLVAAHVSNNTVTPSEVPPFLHAVHSTLLELSATKEPPAPKLEPAVPVKQSIKPDYIVCLEDGKKLRMLKRYLKTQYGLTPDEYRAKWGLPTDYPMNAPGLAAQRSDTAKRIGLGRKRNVGA